LLAAGIDVDGVEEGTVLGFEGADDAGEVANVRDGEYGLTVDGRAPFFSFESVVGSLTIANPDGVCWKYAGPLDGCICT
jgi:hypothetical protein